MWTREELAWLGGLFEGEGHMTRPRKDSPLRIKIAMTDRDTLERFCSLSKIGYVSGPFKPSGLGKKERYEYTVSGKRAYALGAAIWPYLCSRRQSQVAEAFRLYAQLSPYRSLTPDQVREIKSELNKGGHGIGRRLAEEYKVTDGLISAIKTNRLWSHIT